tara:strand:+ start:594 stop:749 length:156 start_codon:yes stop_codon:yes gene_type:complete
MDQGILARGFAPLNVAEFNEHAWNISGRDFAAACRRLQSTITKVEAFDVQV